MAIFVVALHVVGWGMLTLVVVPQNFHLGSGQGFGIGLGVTAYVLGLRHAFDADHIAAIDNTTRKLMHTDNRPLSVGFWFSLGHSSIVFGLCLLIAAGVRALAVHVDSDTSALHSILGLIGTSVSGVFLWIIGVLNLLALAGILKVFRRMRNGRFDDVALENQLNNRGLMNRIFGRVTRVVTKPGQMYVVGLLFGLGFDTATEVSLLIVAGGAVTLALPWYAILTLPVLFAAGMSLLDSIDGCFMNFAYGWAFAQPARKIYYNLSYHGLLRGRSPGHRYDRTRFHPGRQGRNIYRNLGCHRPSEPRQRRLWNRFGLHHRLALLPAHLEVRARRREMGHLR